jgi:hypothetical protein
MTSMKIKLYKQYSSWPCSICLSSLSCLFTGFIVLLDPHCQSDSSHPDKVCLILGNEDRDGTFSDFVYCPLGRPGLPYFQSSYPVCILGAVSYSTLPSSPLTTWLSLDPYKGVASLLSVFMYQQHPADDSGLCF